MLDIPDLIGCQKFDTYYFAIAIEPKKGFSETKNAVAQLIMAWKRRLRLLVEGQVIYLPIDFSDQYTGCIRVEKQNDLYLTFGYSRREGYTVDPINPSNYFDSITDYRTQNVNPLIVSQSDFEKCLDEQIEKLKIKNVG